MLVYSLKTRLGATSNLLVQFIVSSLFYYHQGISLQYICQQANVRQPTLELAKHWLWDGGGTA